MTSFTFITATSFRGHGSTDLVGVTTLSREDSISYTFIKVTANHTISPTFASIQ